MEIKYQEADLDDVIRYFGQGYDITDKKLHSFEYFVDPIKGKVVYKLYLKEKDKDE